MAGQGAGDPLRLVVAAGEAAAPVERHGDDPVAAGEPVPQSRGERRRQVLPEIVQAPELEPAHHGVEGRPVAPEREQPVEGGRAPPAGAAPVVRREGVGGERPGADRAGFPRQWRERRPAGDAEAERGAPRRQRPSAAEARGGQQGMDQPVEQALSRRDTRGGWRV